MCDKLHQKRYPDSEYIVFQYKAIVSTQDYDG